MPNPALWRKRRKLVLGSSSDSRDIGGGIDNVVRPPWALERSLPAEPVRIAELVASDLPVIEEPRHPGTIAWPKGPPTFPFCAVVR
jgi:hypothetical protein